MSAGLLAFTLFYRDYGKIYPRAIDAVKREIEEYFSDIGADHIHYVRGRVKDMQRIADKMGRKKYDDIFEQMDDIAGVRVVCHNKSDVEQVASFIRSRYAGQIKSDEKIDKKGGYSAHHFVVVVTVLFAGTPHKTKVEVQLRTVAEDFYDTLSRRDMYEVPALPEEWLKKMELLSGKVKEIDALAEELKQEWIEANISTKVKNVLNAPTLIHLTQRYLNESLTTDTALNCLTNLMRYGVSTLIEVEQVLTDTTILAELDVIYAELLGRRADAAGKIIYGSFLYKNSKISTDSKQAAIEIIKNSIRQSKEYFHKHPPLSFGGGAS